MNKDNFNIHLWWGLITILSLILLISAIIYVQNNAWIVRFEMDNNTLEAIKHINWTEIWKQNG